MKCDLLIILGLIAITLAAFIGVGACGFVNLDDPGYIQDNPHVTQGLSRENAAWAWNYNEGNFIPLTWLSLMLDVTLFGRGPHGFHWVNLGFHVANAIFLYLFFRHASGSVWRSALVASVFSVHPLRVESVAWIVERKDVLSGFFGLLAMLAYLRYTRRLNVAWYLAGLLMFAASLLAKQTLATLPCLLLLLDYWPLGRWDRGPAPLAGEPAIKRCWTKLVIEKLPLILVTLLILRHTLQAQSLHAMSDLKTIPMSWRLGNVPLSYARYLLEMVWFQNLAVFYPRYPLVISQVVTSTLVLGMITIFCLSRFRTAPWFLIGWLWFLGVLVPMIGIQPFGPQAMADRFTYFASIGLVLMMAWSIPRVAARQVQLTATVAGIALGTLIIFTMKQTFYWQNSEQLFKHDIEVAGSSPLAEINLGAALFDHARQLRKSGDESGATAKLGEAAAHFRQAAALEPTKARPHADLALVLSHQGKLAEAVKECGLAADLEPTNAQWRKMLADLAKQEKSPVSP